MARQLIFTSVPRGLDAGKSGYCTVARHRDLRERLIPQIERLGTYQHLNLSVDGHTINPVVCSHRIIAIAGEHYHVLTRIVDAGLDYSRRSNYFAHHLILDEREIERAPQPADIFLGWPGWLNQWTEGPRLFGPEDEVDVTNLAKGLPPALPAKTWESLAGHAACAAAPLELTTPRTGFLVRPGKENSLVALFRETSALLNPREQWNTTFTTFLQPTDAHNEFRWFGIWSGRHAEQGAQTSILDLTQLGVIPVPTSALARRAAAQPMAAVIKPQVLTPAFNKSPALTLRHPGASHPVNPQGAVARVGARGFTVEDAPIRFLQRYGKWMGIAAAVLLISTGGAMWHLHTVKEKESLEKRKKEIYENAANLTEIIKGDIVNINEKLSKQKNPDTKLSEIIKKVEKELKEGEAVYLALDKPDISNADIEKARGYLQILSSAKDKIINARQVFDSQQVVKYYPPPPILEAAPQSIATPPQRKIEKPEPLFAQKTYVIRGLKIEPRVTISITKYIWDEIQYNAHEAANWKFELIPYNKNDPPVYTGEFIYKKGMEWLADKNAKKGDSLSLSSNEIKLLRSDENKIDPNQTYRATITSNEFNIISLDSKYPILVPLCNAVKISRTSEGYTIENDGLQNLANGINLKLVFMGSTWSADEMPAGSNKFLDQQKDNFSKISIDQAKLIGGNIDSGTRILAVDVLPNGQIQPALKALEEIEKDIKGKKESIDNIELKNSNNIERIKIEKEDLKKHFAPIFAYQSPKVENEIFSQGEKFNLADFIITKSKDSVPPGDNFSKRFSNSTFRKFLNDAIDKAKSWDKKWSEDITKAGSEKNPDLRRQKEISDFSKKRDASVYIKNWLESIVKFMDQPPEVKSDVGPNKYLTNGTNNQDFDEMFNDKIHAWAKTDSLIKASPTDLTQQNDYVKRVGFALKHISVWKRIITLNQSTELPEIKLFAENKDGDYFLIANIIQGQ